MSKKQSLKKIADEMLTWEIGLNELKDASVEKPIEFQGPERLDFEILYEDKTKSFEIISGKKAVAIKIDKFWLHLDPPTHRTCLTNWIDKVKQVKDGGKKWKVASKEELLLLFERRQEIDEAIKKLGGTELGEREYWSLTVKNDERCYVVQIDNGWVSDYNSKYHDSYVRYVAKDSTSFFGF